MADTITFTPATQKLRVKKAAAMQQLTIIRAIRLAVPKDVT